MPWLRRGETCVRRSESHGTKSFAPFRGPDDVGEGNFRNDHVQAPANPDAIMMA